MDVKYVLLIVIAWVALLRIIKSGIAEVIRIPQVNAVPKAQPAPVHTAPQDMNLRCLSGQYKGSVFPVSGNRLVFGRDSKRANIVFPPSTPGISSVHCEISFERGIVCITDKNSRYGTFLADGTRLTPEKPFPLSPHCGFYLANRENLFEIE